MCRVIVIYTWSHSMTHTHTHTFGRTPLEEGSARFRGLYLHNTQLSQETDIHATGRIQTRNPSKRGAADLCLKPRGHRDQQYRITKHRILSAQLICTYLITPWSRVLLEKLTGLQLVKKFPALYGTRKFITAFTTTRHLSLS